MADIGTAFQAFDRGRVADAEALCRTMLVQSPWLPPLVGLLGKILLQTNRPAEAAALAAGGLEHDPGDAELLTVRGRALAQLGDETAAIDCLSRAIERRLFSPEAHAALADLLARRGDRAPHYRVSIITPTLGTALLAQAVASVQAQTYPLVEHFIIVDGRAHAARARAALPPEPLRPIHVLELPYNVGGGGFEGHRAYGAAPFLVNGDFIAYLDEDNWLEPEHVAALLETVIRGGLTWAYALRKVVDAEGHFLVNDDCESLGKWPIWNRPDLHHVDTNCYLLRRDVALTIAPRWYRRRNADGLNADMAVCLHLLAHEPRCDTSGRYTVNYRVGMTGTSVPLGLFEAGNQAMRHRYGARFPWASPPPPATGPASYKGAES